MKIERVLLFVFLGFLGLWILKRATCGHSWSGDWPTGETVRGSGNVTSQQREVGDFDRLVVDGVIDVELRQGDVAALRLEGDDNVLDKITTRIDDGRLEISMRSGFSFKKRSKIRAFVTVRDLREVSMTGVGELVCPEPLSLRSLEANLSGVGKIELHGTCDEAELVNSGVGQIEADDFVCQKLRVVNSGAGNVRARAEREIEVENTGVGNVEWSGAASATNVSSTGVGKVRKL